MRTRLSSCDHAMFFAPNWTVV